MIHSLPPASGRRRLAASALVLAAVLGGSLPAAGRPQSAEEKAKAGRAEKAVRITEEIQVVGERPREQPVSTVTRIDFTRLDANRPLDLAEAIRFAPGVAVTVGNKNEFTLKLRGMDSRRIVLLIDGVPSYEPYYGSFDLKTVAAAGIETLQITKGPSSVLYGPNTLGGIVNVITRRPGSDPYLTLNAGFGAERTRSGGLDGGVRLGKLSLAGNVGFQGSHGYSFPDAATGDAVDYGNTGYRRFNLNAKAFYAPGDSTELMINANVYDSDYGMPAATGVQSPRYWRFKNWDRYGLNAGGFTSLGGESSLRFRAFAVSYRNTLDQYKDKAMSIRQFESTFNNSVYGGFALAEFHPASWNCLKASLNYQKDIARTRDDVSLPYVDFDQATFSAAVEDEARLSEAWSVVGGLSLDVIDKHVGGSASRLNPMLGLKFSPTEALDVHASASLKSRLPNMRALYSTSSGNPDLLSETGRNAEVGLTWTRGVTIAAAVFTHRFRNMIDTYTLPDGSRRSMNVGKAHITGAEIQLQKALGPVEASLNYTYLEHRNDADGRPLDALSPHSLSFDLTARPFGRLRVSLYGLYGAQSNWWDSKAGKILDIPSYFSLDAVLACGWRRVEVFVKATNLLDDYFYVEPVFPWRGRFVEVGAKIRVF